MFWNGRFWTRNPCFRNLVATNELPRQSMLYAVCCCLWVLFYGRLKKKGKVNNKCTGNNLGEWSPSGGLLVYLIAKLHLKCLFIRIIEFHLYLLFDNFNFNLRDLAFDCVSNVWRMLKSLHPNSYYIFHILVASSRPEVVMR